MPIKNYTTKVPAVQTVGEIQGILAAHGARKVMMDYAENGKVTAVTFSGAINAPSFLKFHSACLSNVNTLPVALFVNVYAQVFAKETKR